MSTSNPPSGASVIPETTREVVRIIEVDHKATTELIARLTTLRGGLRGILVALFSTLLGLAIAQQSWLIAAIGIPVIAAGLFAESRTDFLVRLAHNRSVRLEHKIQTYISAVIETGVVGDDARRKFQREVDTFQFGTSRSLRGISAKNALKASLRNPIFWLYIFFVAALSATAISFGILASTTSGPGPTKCATLSNGAVVEFAQQPKVLSGQLQLGTCPAGGTSGN